MSDKPKFVYVIYIASTPDKVFSALTDAKTSARYWFGYEVTSEWKVGADVCAGEGRQALGHRQGVGIRSAAPAVVQLSSGA